MPSIDFDEEIIRHLQWKTMIEALLHSGVETVLSPSVLMADNKCNLGKWIFSEESNEYEANAAFRRLMEAHKEFHNKAGMVFSLYQGGRKDEAEDIEIQFNDA